jgi:hypothetical protein
MGNVNYEEVVVRKDIIFPLVDITNPSPDGAQTGGFIISLSGLAYGTGSNIVSIYINDTRWGDGSQKPQTDPSGSQSGAFVFNNNTVIAPGFYWIEINITDAAGNSNTSIRYFEVIIEDTTPPILVISSISPDPTNGYTVITIISNENLKSLPLLNITLPNSSVIYRPMILIAVLTWSANYTVDADGIYTVRINGTDDADNVGYTTDTFEGDITAPIITINIPNLNDLFGITAPSYDLTVTDANLDSIWYSLDGGTTNSTPVSATGTINLAMWSGRPNGTVTIRFYANDTVGNVNYQDVVVRKDIIVPNITINSPSTNDLFGTDAPSYDLTVTDANLDSIWYSLDGGTTNSTPVSVSGTINLAMWSGRPNGSVMIRFYANDTVGNVNYQDVVVRKDIIAPNITINSPSTNDLFGTDAPSYNLIVMDTNFDSIWYSFDGGITNSTAVSGIGTIDQAMWSGLSNGTVTIRFYANDTVGNVNYQDVVVRKDVIAPTITIIEPNNYDLVGITPPVITININDPNLGESWYQLDNGTIITSNYTWTGSISQIVWDQVGNGTVIIRFYANDTVGNLGTAEVVVYKDIFLPIITINTPSANEVCNGSAPGFIVSISGSNLDTRWYTLDDGLINHTFAGLIGIIDQLAWDAPGDGTVTIKFYINNTLGVIGFDEITVIKDTSMPFITINLPSNNTYCGTEPLINILASDANLEYIWYEVNTIPIFLGNNIDQQLDTSIWDSLPEGEFNIYLYANDSVNHLSDPIMVTLYKDTIAPVAPLLLSFPQGEVRGNLLFEWQEGSDPSGIVEYRLIIDNEADPFATPGVVFEIYVTGDNYTYIGSLQPGTYYFSLYQIDGTGHQSPAATGSFSIGSSSQPSEFPFWIIIVIIGAAIGGIVGVMVLKKSKNKKVGSVKEEAPPKEMEPKIQLEMEEEFTLLDYETLKAMNREELSARESILMGNIKNLEENQKYVKATELLGEIILVEELLDNPTAVQSYRQQQIDFAVNGLDNLKDQYEIESKNAAVSGDYSKSLELYKESKLISENLKLYLEQQKSALPKEDSILETKEHLRPIADTEIVYSCINDLLTKYFDDIGIKYYYNPQIHDDINKQIHGLILTDDKFLIKEVDPSIRDTIKAIQLLFVEDISHKNVRKLGKIFQNSSMILMIIGIRWPKDVESQTFEVIRDKKIKYPENIKIGNFELFADLIGLKGTYKVALEEIINLYDKSDLDILQKSHESSTVKMHDTNELIHDLKDKGLIKKKLAEYFHK